MSFFCRTKNALHMPRRAADRRVAAPADICASAPRRACGATGTAPVGNTTSALQVFRGRRRRFTEAPSTAAATCDIVCPRCKCRGTCKNLSSCHECNRHGHCCCDHAPRRPRAPPRGPKTDTGVQRDIDCNGQTLHAHELHDTRATTMLRPPPLQRTGPQHASTTAGGGKAAACGEQARSEIRSVRAATRKRTSSAAFRTKPFSAGKSAERKMCISKRRPSYFRTIFGPGEAGGPFGPPEGPPANGCEGKPARPGD